MSASWYSFTIFQELANILTTFFPCHSVDVLQRASIVPRDPTPAPDCEPVNEPVDHLVNERIIERTDEATDAPASGLQPNEPVDERVDGTLDRGIGIGGDINELIDEHIYHQVDEPTAEHKKLFDVKEDKKSTLNENDNENDNSDDEDKERENFLLVSWLLSGLKLSQSTLNSGRVGESEEQKIGEERGYS
jgi:hypothetical protein